VLRSVVGFAILAVITVFLLKLMFGLFGLALGFVATLLWFAFLGFLIYLILKVIAPGAAARVREMIGY